nr:MAG TPA: hypothetical protein [Caudoviricetes sp.]
MRRQILKIAKASHTPITFFLDLPIMSLYRWIESLNENINEELEEMKKKKR